MARGDNRVTANEIAAYTGNAAAGLAGSGVNSYAPDNTVITQTARDLALQSFAANQILHRDFKEDQEKANKMIDDDKLVPTEIAEEDRPIVDEKLKKLQEIFYSVNGDLVNNPKAYREFVAAKNDALSHIKHSQKVYAWRNAELNRLKDISNPYEQEEFRKGMMTQQGKRKDNYWYVPEPFAPITDYKLDIVAPSIEYGSEVTKTDGLYTVKTTTADIPATFDKFTKLFGQKANTDQFYKYVKQFSSDPAAIERVNTRLKEKFGDRVPAIDMTKDRADIVAAKIALADNEASKTERKFDDQRADYNLGLKKIAADERQANQRASIDWYNAKTSRISATTKTEKEKTAATVATTEASTFTDALMDKIAAATDANGNVDISKLNLTEQELQMMGTASIGDKGFKLTALPNTALSESTIRFDKDKKEIIITSKGDKPKRTVIDYKQVANNKYDFNMQTTAGKEDVGRSQLTSGYGSTEATAPIALSGKIDPSTLNTKDVYTVNGVNYKWNGTKLVPSN